MIYTSGSKVPCHLINTAELLLDAAIAPNTKRTYSTAIDKMLIFLDKHFPKAELVDFTVEKDVLFIAYLRLRFNIVFHTCHHKYLY
jgi:hypothetical protein